MNLLSKEQTIISEFKASIEKYGVDLKIKRDDLFPYFLGGNKARKIISIGEKAIDDGYNVLITNGGIQSNHCRATALFCAEHNIKCRLVLHVENKDNKLQGNYLLSYLAGAQIDFTSLSGLSDAMDQAMKEEQNKGYKPLYIWGGGHCLEGSLAYYNAFNELIAQCTKLNWIPDYIVIPSGTGTTQAGIHVGNERIGWNTQVIGISVAREKERGRKVVEESCIELREYLGMDNAKCDNVLFFDEYTCGGYEKYNASIGECIREIAKEGVFLDPTYTGKAFWGFTQLVEKRIIPKGSRVLFWHTGGLYNLLATNFDVE